MITDAQTRLSSQQALTSGTIVSTNSYDLGTARDVGRGHPLRVIVTVDTAFAGGTSVTPNIIESANADLSSPTVIGAGETTAEAALTQGAKIMDRVLPKTSKRYIGLQYANAGTHSAGTVSANIVLDTDSSAQFPANTGL